MHNWGKEQALAFIKAHPWRAVALIPFKFMHFWNLEQNMFLVAYSFNYIGAVPVPLLVVFFVFLLIPFAFLTVFSVVGVAFAEAFDRKLWLLLLLVLYYSALHSVVFGEARLHLPLIPILAILAANGLLRLRHARKALASDDTVVRRGARARAAVAAACIAGFIGIWVYGFIYTLPKWAAVLTPGGNTAQLPY